MSDISNILFVKKLEDMDYSDVHYVSDGPFAGKWIGIYRFIFTWGLVVGINDTGYDYRYCYENLTDARCGIKEILEGKEPTGYIKKK